MERLHQELEPNLCLRNDKNRNLKTTRNIQKENNKMAIGYLKTAGTDLWVVVLFSD